MKGAFGLLKFEIWLFSMMLFNNSLVLYGQLGLNFKIKTVKSRVWNCHFKWNIERYQLQIGEVFPFLDEWNIFIMPTVSLKSAHRMFLTSSLNVIKLNMGIGRLTFTEFQMDCQDYVLFLHNSLLFIKCGENLAPK